ncbi:MAG TPA: tetratricopeptide repeat protein [Pyrinomonadaceae bacterium]|nr:tetratricopeptide repeat protein [Pyrinomonadaceae bacterium]
MRVAISIFGIACCLFLIQASARFGVSRLFVKYATVTNSIEAADAAVQIAPSDPDTHRARATLLNSLQQPDEAAKSLERATALRYRDDYLWIDLGNTREEAGDTQAALAALDQAVRWAPHYAHTHWQRGNLLLRMGQANEAFTELRTAAAANPRYAPNLIDLAWNISRHDVKTTEALLDIKDYDERVAFIYYLARNGKGGEVLDQIRLLAAPLTTDNQIAVGRLLFDAKDFRESFELLRTSETTPLIDGGFEGENLVNQSGFGWILIPDPKTRLTVDIAEKLSGKQSLAINFDGAWPPRTPLSQTFIVEPNTSYRISFSVKTKDLITGGPPLLVVNDATNDQLLSKSESFPTATTSWTKLNVDFTTLLTSQAAVIRLQRSNCDSSPCPIFGTLWLDEFSVEQTKLTSKR